MLKKHAPGFKLLTIVFLPIELVTLNKIGPFTIYEISARIRFSKRVNSILRDFKAGKSDFKEAKLALRDIIASN